MVKVINPLFSNSAAGRVGGLVYQSGTYGPYVKGHVPQHRKPTALQLQQNTFFGLAADAWRVLTDEQQQEWNVKAYGLGMSGYNLFIKKNIQHPE